MEKRELTCIGCPLGCSITVTLNGKEVTSVTGNTCSRGAIYAKKEVTDPTRIVTSSVRVTGGTAPMVSVKTKEDIPKSMIFDCTNALKDITVAAPVRIGDVILSDAAAHMFRSLRLKILTRQNNFRSLALLTQTCYDGLKSSSLHKESLL